WKMEGPLKLYRWPIALCLLLHLYLVSSWPNYFYGWSFGHRAFVDALGLFALPLAVFYKGVMSLPKTLARRGIAVIATLFVVLTFYSFFQFFQGILLGEMDVPMTWREYKNVLLNPDGFKEFGDWLKAPQINNHRLSR
ncbi:MAG TPA: hypothetical protein VK564_06275, partial [Thermodesulfobacteriota bacterium]|nr:hypothetical protein [Thermodesulfobacteriota bacterium]